MEHFELVEKLVNTFGVSYEKAKEALELSDWDPIDAAIYLEKEKNGNLNTANEQVYQETSDEQVSQEASGEQVFEEPSAEQTQPDEHANVNRGPKGSSFNIPVEEMKQAGSSFFKTLWDFLSLNSFVVKKSSGEVFLDIPIWLAGLLLCAFFWAVVVVLVIVFIMGYRFSFSGPQLGRKNVKNTVDQVGNAADEFVSKVKNAVAPDNCEPVEEQPEIVVEEKVSEEKILEKIEEKMEEKAAGEKQDVTPSSDTIE